jgi:hypothetical protein
MSALINIFETNLDGHRARYLGELVRGALGFADGSRPSEDCLGNQVRLCIPVSLRHSQAYIEHLSGLEDSIELCPLPEIKRTGRFREEWTRLKALGRCVRSHPCDRLIIAYGDGLIPLLGLLPRFLQRRYMGGTRSVEAILFRPSWVYPANSFLDHVYHQIRGWATSRWQGSKLCFLDQNACLRVEQGLDRYAAKVVFVPELLDEFTPWRREDALGWLSSHGYFSDSILERLRLGNVYSLPGVPSLRKGTVLLTDAFVRGFKDLDGTLLFWDEFPYAVERSLNERKIDWRSDPRVIICQKRVSIQAFQALFSLSDIICLPYQNDRGVSSLYLLSAIHRKKVLCDDRGWLAWASKTFGHGYAVGCTSPESIAMGLSLVHLGHSIPIACDSVRERIRTENNPTAFRRFLRADRWSVESESHLGGSGENAN